MKKKLLFLLPLLLVPLTACDLSGAGEDNDESDVQDSSVVEEKLNFDKDSVFNKLKTYGQTVGFDITFETQATESEKTKYDVAMKNDMVWLVSNNEYTGIKLGDNKITAFASSDNGQTFQTNDLTEDDLGGKTPAAFFDSYLDSLTTWFYFASTYSNLGLTKTREITFVDREVTEYSMSMMYGGQGATFTTYIDKELGITVYWYSESITEEGKEFVEFKVISFKSGNAVVAPNIQ